MPRVPLKRSTLMQQRAHARWLRDYEFALSGPAGVSRGHASDPVREEDERFALAIIERTLSWALRERGVEPVAGARRECQRRAAARRPTERPSGAAR